jgi:hypothetical protein
MGAILACRQAGVLVILAKLCNYMILFVLKSMPCFLAEQEKSFARGYLGELMTFHSQGYPQFLGISRHFPYFAGLAGKAGGRQNPRLMFMQGFSSC